MTLPLTDQRSREDLIAELYDRHAAGLFAYCADQLGDTGSASDALDAVLSSAPSVEPPRAALYALARREIFRRDIVYAPPVIDPLVDPATALVERVLRELRPHQREVLVLSVVIGLTDAELAWVLDVANDTAVELIQNAALRFRQSLLSALGAAGPRLSQPVAEVYGALGVAPLRDVLGRLPWRPPPAAIRIRLLGPRPAAPAPAAARTTSLFVRPLWPTSPTWPVPLSDPDPATSTGIFPTELLTPPDPSRVSPHEAATAPMPKLREGRSPRHPLMRDRPLPRSSAARGPVLSAPTPGDVLDAPSAWDAFSKPAVQERPADPPAGDILDDHWTAAPPGHVPDVTADSTDVPMRGRDRRALADLLVHKGEPRPEPSLFAPRRPAKEPVYVLPPDPAGTPVQEEPKAEEQAREARTSAEAASAPLAPEPARPALPEQPKRPAPQKGASPKSAPQKSTPRKSPAQGSPAQKRPAKKAATGKAGKTGKGKAAAKKKGKRRNRHHDWAWEVAGFLVCVAIAMLVFFWVPR
ncbi:RNA polymerase sigma factor [Nonomuraea dietziae]|uniref:RNA polymerase sigma factor n=1 Tax=Nonomuraea dietziae TaxID=65515 RepID=UPI0033EB776E